MTYDFGVPPLSTTNRSLVEQRLGEVGETGGVPETLKIEFREQPLNVQVIDMPVTQLFYNPGTHRIRAQRSHDAEKDRALDIDPWSEGSQEYLRYLLTTQPADPAKRDPRFDELKESLRDYKQLEPGLITRDGILVNGNTRHAALKELGASTIRVGVLPASCTWADIHAVELTLQLRHDRRRDYSYINHLLALEEQVALGRSLSDIARDFHTTTPACVRDAWILNELRELIRRSASGDFSLRLMDFENDKEKLFELYRTVTSEKSREKAELLKEARLAAITLDFAKTDVRNIGSDFQARFLEQRLPDALKPSAAAPAAVTIPGLNRTVPTAGPQVAAARALTDKALKLKAVEVAGDKAGPSQLADASSAKQELKTAFDEAIEFAGKDFRMRKKRQAAPDRVTDACKDLEQCITDLVLARGNGSLDQEAFDDAVLKLRGVMGRLATEAGKTIELPGEGVTWLRAVAVQQ
ncbi:transcriptional regulator [Dactylosporangium sp. NPDC051485]|uniref:transcriptional regulator n=1 Tax=Dactylosporangium sp. NPDC051485 TaxID=3154846 RepID=UPI00341ED926